MPFFTNYDNKMNKFNMYVWIGLAINIALLVTLIYMLQTDELTVGFSHEPSGNALKFMKFLIVIAAISVPLQIISMLTMSYWPQTSMVLAFLGSLVFIPISLVFIFGMTFSATRWRFRKFEPSSPLATYDICLNFTNQRNAFLSGIMLLLGIVLFAMGQSLGMFLIVLAIFRYIIGRRINGTPLLAIKNKTLIFRPTFFSDSYQIPLDAVTVGKEKKSYFYLLINHQGLIGKFVFYHKDIQQDQDTDIDRLLTEIKQAGPEAQTTASI